MNGRNSYLVVGVFVSVGLVMLFYLVLSLAGEKSTEPYQRYTTFFERDVSGLTLGAPVRYLGVAVGEVSAMNLTSAGRTRVRVDIDVLQSTPITEATYASLAFQGVTGVAFISLATGSDREAMRLVAGHSEYPVIQTRDVGLAAVLTEAPEIAHQLALLIDRANRVVDEENSAALSRILVNIDGITDALAGNGELGTSLPEQLSAVLTQAETTFARVEVTLDLVEPEMLQTMSQLNETSAHLAVISERLDGWLTDNDRSMEQFISGGLGQTAALITDTRNTMRALEKLLLEARETPSQFVYKPQNDPVVVDP